jgi:hypothetical protein
MLDAHAIPPFSGALNVDRARAFGQSLWASFRRRIFNRCAMVPDVSIGDAAALNSGHFAIRRSGSVSARGKTSFSMVSLATMLATRCGL